MTETRWGRDDGGKEGRKFFASNLRRMDVWGMQRLKNAKGIQVVG